MAHNDWDTEPDQVAGSAPKVILSIIQNAKLALHTEGPLTSRKGLLSTVDAIKDLLADTYIHLNARAPLNKLPHELLIMIFRQALPTPDTAISFPAAKNVGYKPVLRALTVIAHVCHSWRDIAFGTPALWTRIDARGYPANELCGLLQHSHPLPLSLVLDSFVEREVKENSEILRANSARLHRLDLDVVTLAPSVVEELLSFDGSTLRCLTISSSILKGRPNPDRDGLTHSTVSILHGQTHSLKALAVVPSLGWVPENHFPCLTQIYISFDISNEPPDPLVILSLLCNTPRLELAHFHSLHALEDLPTFEPPGYLLVDVSQLRSLVFTGSAYHPVVDILHCLSLEPSVLVRLDDLFVPYNSHDPGPIPGHLGPLSHATTMEIADEDDILFLVVEGASSGFWLKVRHTVDGVWNDWISGHLPAMLPLRNIVSLRVAIDRSLLPSILREMVQLSELSVELYWDTFWLATDDPIHRHPHVLPLCNLLSQSQPIVCPALRSLAIDWPMQMPQSMDLGIANMIDMLTTRSRLGHPIRRLVVQATPVQFGSIGPTYFSEQLAELAAHVDDYEEWVDPEPRVCAFEMREMWNVEGAEEYWVVDEKQRSRYPGL